MAPELLSAVEASLSAATGAQFKARSVAKASGGCIHSCFVLTGASQRCFARFFVKTNEQSFADAFAAEADGLEALGRAGVRVPTPVALGAHGAYAWLAMEYLELHPGNETGFEMLARALATVHSSQGEAYGWSRNNHIGATPQRNSRTADWSRFWRDERLLPQLQLAAANGHGALANSGERLCARLDSLLRGHQPAASLLHGDLWSGNASFLADGTPVLFDPAVYYGDAEADLAMTELFGGFSGRFYAAYREIRPLDPGYSTRKILYNLYHVLNHANLFGGGYAAQALRMMEQLLGNV